MAAIRKASKDNTPEARRSRGTCPGAGCNMQTLVRVKGPDAGSPMLCDTCRGWLGRIAVRALDRGWLNVYLYRCVRIGARASYAASEPGRETIRDRRRRMRKGK